MSADPGASGEKKKQKTVSEKIDQNQIFISSFFSLFFANLEVSLIGS